MQPHALALSALVAFPTTLMAQTLPQTLPPVEWVIVMDTTGSTGALLPNWRAQMKTEMIDLLEAIHPGSRYAIVKHEDFPWSPWGSATDVPYRLIVPMTAYSSWDTVAQPALNAMTSGNGRDTAESQYVAITLGLTEAGLDLNNDGDYTDPGEIDPANNVVGINATRDCAVVHFTSPDVFHDRDVEPTYPTAGLANTQTPGKAAAENALTRGGSQAKYYLMQSEPLDGPSATGDGAALAARTGGIVVNAGTRLENLRQAVLEILIARGGCPATVTGRSGAGNLGAYAASSMVIGQRWNATISLITTPYTAATVVGSFAPANLPFAGGTILIDPLSPPGGVLSFPLTAGPLARFQFPVPNLPELCGATIYTQGVVVDPSFRLGLTNAQDCLLGTVRVP